MKSNQKTKLKDYLLGLKKLKGSYFFPIGAIVFKEEDQDSILRVVKDEKLTVVKTDGVHPDVILSKLIKIINEGKGLALNINKELSPKILNQLNNLTNNQIYVNLAGQKKPVILNPVPVKSFIVLLMNDKLYQLLIIGDIISSYCNLVR